MNKNSTSIKKHQNINNTTEIFKILSNISINETYK